MFWIVPLTEVKDFSPIHQECNEFNCKVLSLSLFNSSPESPGKVTEGKSTLNSNWFMGFPVVIVAMVGNEAEIALKWEMNCRHKMKYFVKLQHGIRKKGQTT